MTEPPRRPNTAMMRQCASSHRTLANIYDMDISPDAQVTADGSRLTAALLEAAAEFVDAVPPVPVEISASLAVMRKLAQEDDDSPT